MLQQGVPVISTGIAEVVDTAWGLGDQWLTSSVFTVQKSQRIVFKTTFTVLMDQFI
jgi:hypothetical protein